MQAPIVHKIEASSRRPDRVAAYARVSTHKENQEESFETQVRYYETLIQSRPDWKLAEIYADQGFSGVNAESRPGFMAMIRAAEAGEFDILLVRSISRFARNVSEAQVYCRRLKICGVEVRFEKEGLSSTDASAEMAFHLLAACAQEESRSISERTKWSIHKLQAQGVLHIGNKALGYREVDGVLTPNEEAWAVQAAFSLFARGKSMTEVADWLNNCGFRRSSNQKQLTRAHIRYILQNPIYAGDRLMQRQPPKNYMTHRPDPSQAYDSYYGQDTHEPLVSRDLWEAVQERLLRIKRLRALGVKPSKNSHCLYGLLFCGACGAPMKRRSATSGGRHTAIWRCAGHSERAGQLKGKGAGCAGTGMPEAVLVETLCGQLLIVDGTLEEKTAALAARKDEIDYILVNTEDVMIKRRTQS